MTNEYFLAEFCDNEQLIDTRMPDFYTAAMVYPSTDKCAELLFLQWNDIDNKSMIGG
jgi:hypothetical protein